MGPQSSVFAAQKLACVHEWSSSGWLATRKPPPRDLNSNLTDVITPVFRSNSCQEYLPPEHSLDSVIGCG
jgi:hypothetical protein